MRVHAVVLCVFQRLTYGLCLVRVQGFLMLLGTYSNVFETPLTAFTTLFPLRYNTLPTARATSVHGH